MEMADEKEEKRNCLALSPTPSDFLPPPLPHKPGPLPHSTTWFCGVHKILDKMPCIFFLHHLLCVSLCIFAVVHRLVNRRILIHDDWYKSTPLIILMVMFNCLMERLCSNAKCTCQINGAYFMYVLVICLNYLTYSLVFKISFDFFISTVPKVWCCRVPPPSWFAFSFSGANK